MSPTPCLAQFATQILSWLLTAWLYSQPDISITSCLTRCSLYRPFNSIPWNTIYAAFPSATPLWQATYSWCAPIGHQQLLLLHTRFHVLDHLRVWVITSLLLHTRECAELIGYPKPYKSLEPRPNPYITFRCMCFHIDNGHHLNNLLHTREMCTDWIITLLLLTYSWCDTDWSSLKLLHWVLMDVHRLNSSVLLLTSS